MVKLETVDSGNRDLMDKYKWLSTLKCEKCKCMFYFCNECDNMTTTIKCMIRMELSIHHKKYHKNEINNDVTKKRKSIRCKNYIAMKTKEQKCQNNNTQIDTIDMKVNQSEEIVNSLISKSFVGTPINERYINENDKLLNL